MAENEMINVLIITENILGIYRNFSYLPKKRQVFIAMRTAVEFIITCSLFWNRVYYLAARFENKFLMTHIMIMYHFVILITGAIIILCCMQSSCNYKIFITKYMKVQTSYRNEQIYTKSLKRLKIFFIVASSICLFTSTSNLMLKVTTKYYLQKEKFILSYFMLMMIEMIHEIRFMMEHVVLYIYIILLRSFLKCINQSISHTQIKYDHIEKRLYKDRMESNEILTVVEVEHWAKMYESMVLCSKNLSICFRMLMGFTLVFSSVHYVTSAYGIFCIILTNNADEYFSGVNLSYGLLLSLICAYSVLCAGQNLFNEWSTTHRNLSKLYSTLSIEPKAPETKGVKNLNLLVQVNPIKIEHTNKIYLGMYLIPIILSLCVSSLITALQVNHII